MIHRWRGLHLRRNQDCDTVLKSTWKSTKRRPSFSQTGTSSLLGPNVAVTRKRCSCQAPLVKDPTGSTTLLSNTARSSTLTYARICTPMSRCHVVARPACSEEPDGVGSIHDEDHGGFSTRESSWYGILRQFPVEIDPLFFFWRRG